MMMKSMPPEDEGPNRVLVVDDDDDRRRMFTIILRKSGFEVGELADGRKLLDTVRTFQPELILLDIMLPGQTGIELTRAVRADPELRSTPIILMTAALSDEDSIVRGLACGADDYVVTPVGHEELKARIRVQLRNRRDRELLRWAVEQRHQYKEESRRDPLTNLANRRAGQEVLESALAQGTPVSIAMVDIDHFKRVNDNYGHPAGDEVLKCVANTLAAGVGEEDVVARFGGEEFAVILRSVAPSMAKEIAEQLRLRVAQLTFPDVPEVPSVTISIGLASYDGGDFAPEATTLIADSDAALYAAKESGRDRVVVHGAPVR